MDFLVAANSNRHSINYLLDNEIFNKKKESLIKRVSLLLFAIILVSNNSFAQPYIEGGITRHRFAQLNLGLDQRLFSGAGSGSAVLNANGQIETFELNNHAETRLLIGGTHFWGHTDFYIAIPILSLGKSGFTTGVETGAKYYPWRIEHNKIRPYVGIAMLPTRFRQGQGTENVLYTFPITSGATYGFKNKLIELGLGYNYNNTFNYYISPTTVSQVKSHPAWIALGFKFMIDATVSAEKDWLNGKTQKLTDTLSALHRLNGLTFAIGPSSAFLLKSSSHNQEVAPYAGNPKSFRIFPEFGLGYYLHKPDLQLNLSYRSMQNKIRAYDFTQTAKRTALTFEAFKFLFDYHGFALFAGLNLSYEWMNINENLDQQLTSGTYYGIKPGFTFGWDIRPNRIQSWYLRTNLRYFPNLKVNMPDNNSVSFDQLEFNFIQLIVFPGRLF